ncbi:terminase large subunit domain-containing protein [Reyranella sp.]|uniref:terminase large subunit domain-containing protein n=1 Tax=Reyranella sp. TaxID=1929291 RepID=UPI003782E740
MTSMASDLARALDRGRWFADASYQPDAWQQRAATSSSKRQLWNVHRQGGKSLTAGVKAIAHACEEPGAPVLVIAPAMRQAAETIRTVAALHSRVSGLPSIVNQSVHRVELSTGSRIISLPSSEGTIRGFSKVALLILDEASRIPDEIIAACRPMLAVSDGEMVALSTPRGMVGWFYEQWANGGDGWERVRVPVTECPRISAEFLEEEKRLLGPSVFNQEYLCEFVADDSQVFPNEVIAAAFTSEVTPLWPQ